MSYNFTLIVNSPDNKFGKCTLEDVSKICKLRNICMVNSEEGRVKEITFLFDNKDTKDNAVYNVFHKCYGGSNL